MHSHTLETPTLLRPDLPRLQRAWCMYDWANSVYSLVITTAIFPIYYGAVTQNGVVSFFGLKAPGESIYSYSLSFSFLLIALLNPVLGGLADYSGKRKSFLKGFCYLGAASCAGLFFFTEDRLELGVILFILATCGFCGSLVFYNAWLPELAPPDRQERLSARGFSYGYIGSVILLVLCLLPIVKPDWFGGISGGLASRLSFLATGIWWAGFAQITFNALPNPAAIGKGVQSGILKGIKTLRHTFNTVIKMPEAGRYLGTYFIYNMGVQTIMYLATLFASKELNLPQEGLIGTMLLLQIIAIPGAIACARLAERFGRYKVLASLAFLWMLVCVAAFGLQTASQFYALAAVVGVGMGGIQSLSRATWSGLLPGEEHGHASFFGVFDFVDKVSIVCGTLLFGLISQITGSMRLSALTLASFFLIGFILLIGLQISYGKKRVIAKPQY